MPNLDGPRLLKDPVAVAVGREHHAARRHVGTSANHGLNAVNGRVAREDDRAKENVARAAQARHPDRTASATRARSPEEVCCIVRRIRPLELPDHLRQRRQQ